MNRSSIAACSFLLLVPFAASCALSEDDLATDDEVALEEIAPEEIAADETAAAPTQSLFGEACLNTDIYITNSRTRDGVNTAIEVRSVSFYNLTEGKWTSEDLVNGIMNFGQTLLWSNEDLADAEGDTISEWRVYYRYAIGPNWSSEVSQTINTTNETCIADSNFELTVQ